MYPEYNIISYCSENYKQCFDFSINSWINTNASKIYIYTDGWNIENFHKKVEFIPIVTKTENWIQNTSNKLLCIEHFFNISKEGDNFCFLDMDNLVTSDFGEVFKELNSVALTRIDLPHKTVSAGNVFFIVNKTSYEFFKLWKKTHLKHQSDKKYKDGYRGVAYDQTSLHEITWNDLKGEKRFGIKSLNSHIYNAEHNAFNHHLQKVEQYKSKIIHFKDHRWKNQKFINQMNKVISKF